MNYTITMREIISGMKKIIIEGFDEETLESEEMKAILGGLQLLEMIALKVQ